MPQAGMRMVYRPTGETETGTPAKLCARKIAGLKTLFIDAFKRSGAINFKAPERGESSLKVSGVLRCHVFGILYYPNRGR